MPRPTHSSCAVFCFACVGLSGRLSGGVSFVIALAALICLCCACCYRMRRYLSSLTGQPQLSALPLVGVPAFTSQQQPQQPAPSTWEPPSSSPQRSYHIGDEGAAMELGSTAAQQPPPYSASAIDSSQPAATASTHHPAIQPPSAAQPGPFASYSQPVPPTFAQPMQQPYGPPYTPRPMYGPPMMPGGIGGSGYGIGSLAAAGVGGLLLGELLGGGMGGGLGGGGFDGFAAGDTSFDGGDGRDIGGGDGM